MDNPLTVKELIELLKKMPQDLPVHHHYSNSYNYMDSQWNPPVTFVKKDEKAVFLIGGCG